MLCSPFYHRRLRQVPNVVSKRFRKSPIRGIECTLYMSDIPIANTIVSDNNGLITTMDDILLSGKLLFISYLAKTTRMHIYNFIFTIITRTRTRTRTSNVSFSTSSQYQSSRVATGIAKQRTLGTLSSEKLSLLGEEQSQVYIKPHREQKTRHPKVCIDEFFTMSVVFTFLAPTFAQDDRHHCVLGNDSEYNDERQKYVARHIGSLINFGQVARLEIRICGHHQKYRNAYSQSVADVIRREYE